MDFTGTFFAVKKHQKESLLRRGSVVNIQMFIAFVFESVACSHICCRNSGVWHKIEQGVIIYMQIY